METLISACGLVCSKCKAFIATRTGDEALAEATAREWSQLNGVTIQKDQIWCTGCLTDAAPKYHFCGNLCAIRKCVLTKNIDTCAECSSYPCDLVKPVADALPATVKMIEALRD